jgi:hypothetical protein
MVKNLSFLWLWLFSRAIAHNFWLPGWSTRPMTLSTCFRGMTKTHRFCVLWMFSWAIAHCFGVCGDGLGHSQQLLLLSFIYSYFIYLDYQIPLKTHLLVFTVNPWSKLLINIFCSSSGLTLLFIKSTTIHPLYLWVIKLVPIVLGFHGDLQGIWQYVHFWEGW